MSGCARAEGYYKIDPRDKVKYLPHHRSKTEPAGRTSKVGEGGDGGEESEGEGRFVVSETSFPSCSLSRRVVGVATVPASAAWPPCSALATSAATWPSTTS